MNVNATEGNGVQQAQTPLTAEPSNVDGREKVRGVLPADCRRILIVGAGGFGREVLQWARDAWPHDSERIAGFLSANDDSLRGFDCGIDVVSSPDGYEPADDDGLLLAIGVPYVRRNVAESLLARGAVFLTLIHPTAIVSTSAKIGAGSILCPYSIASDSCQVGRFVLMNYHTSLGHDATAGDFSVLSPYATLGGDAHVGDDVFLGLHASVGPGKSIGARSKISANSAALTNAPSDSIIYGVPGSVVPRLSIAKT